MSSLSFDVLHLCAFIHKPQPNEGRRMASYRTRGAHTHAHTHTLVLHESVHSLFVINEYSMTRLQTHIDPRSPCSALLMPNHLPRGSAVMRHTLSILPCHALSSLLTQHIWSLKRVLQPKRPHEWFDKTPPYETWECYSKGSAMFSHQMSSWGWQTFSNVIALIWSQAQDYILCLRSVNVPLSVCDISARTHSCRFTLCHLHALTTDSRCCFIAYLWCVIISIVLHFYKNS